MKSGESSWLFLIMHVWKEEYLS